MKNSLKKLLLGGAAVLALGVGADAHAQATDNDTINTEAIVVQGIDVVAGNDLDFGSFVTDTAAQTVTIPADGGARTTSGVTLITADPGQVGTFTINADQDTAFQLEAAVTDLTSGGNTMTIATVSVDGGDGTTTSAADILTTGAGPITGFSTATTGTPQTFSIGGVLNVGASQAAGTYAGTLTMTATYE